MDLEARTSSPSLTLFLLYFCYATCAALIFQKFLLPMAPALHAGDGLLIGDSARFHGVAVELAERIRAQGWDVWTIHPTSWTGLNVSLLAALYVPFGNDPALIIPINALLHALSGLLLSRIAQLLWPGAVGRYTGVAAATLFVIFPSALNWYGQVHKDGFAICGSFLALYAWVRLGQRPIRTADVVRALAVTTAGALLVFSVRPYHLLVLSVAFGAAFVFSGLVHAIKRSLRGSVRSIAGRGLCVLVLILAAALSPRTDAESQGYATWTDERGGFTWKPSESLFLPTFVDRYSEVLARTRAGLIEYSKITRAGSLIDGDVMPDNIGAVFSYVPRALQIALFAPFPVSWLEKLSATRLVAIGETFIWYLIAPGMLLALYFRRSAGITSVAIVAGAVLTVYGFTLANVGSLYRVRYPYLFIFLMIGMAGWVELLSRVRARKALGFNTPAQGTPIGAGAPPEPQANAWSGPSIITSSIIVALLTAVGYIGFFVRDVLMAREFGLGGELDAFLVATLIPMFFVSVFTIPLGTAVIPSFVAADRHGRRASQQLVAQVAFGCIWFSLALCAVLLAVGPAALPQFATFSDAKLLRTIHLMLWMLPVVALSGFIALGSGLLNAQGRYAWPAAAQAVVALSAILGVIFFAERFGALAVIVAMFIGQLLNFGLVLELLRRHGISLKPSVPRPLASVGPFLRDYFPLVAGALFVNLAVPVNIGMASTLPEGSVSALGLGNKVIIFVTGIIGTAVATVVLPHFSRIIAGARPVDAQRDLSLFVALATLLTIPISIVLFLLAEPIAQRLFLGGQFEAYDARLVARVLEYGVLQLPFFTVYVILLRFAIASRHSARVAIASLAGLCLNIALNVAFMPRLGAAGIALGTTLSIAFATSMLLVLFHREGHITWVRLSALCMNWMLFMTFAVCLHYHSYAGALATVLAFAFLSMEEWPRLLSGRTRPGAAT